MLEHFQTVLQGMELGLEIDVIYLDFFKAFDRVDHKIVLEKLQAVGITGKLLAWIGVFLIGRKHAVIVDGVLSSIGQVRSGVPQGSVLGPLLFLVLISDIDRELKCAQASSFADDTRLTMYIKSDGDEGIMQSELEKIYTWADENLITLNLNTWSMCLTYRPRAEDFLAQEKVKI